MPPPPRFQRKQKRRPSLLSPGDTPILHQSKGWNGGAGGCLCPPSDVKELSSQLSPALSIIYTLMGLFDWNIKSRRGMDDRGWFPGLLALSLPHGEMGQEMSFPFGPFHPVQMSCLAE